MTYIDPDDLANALGITLSSAERHLTQSLIDRAESVINRHCGTNFNYNLAEEEYVDGHENLEWVYVRHSPLISITSVTHNGKELTADEDYWAYPDVGAVRFLKGITDNTSPKNVEIIYAWGWTDIPPAIQYAMVAMVSNAFNTYRAEFLLEGADMGQIANINLQFTKTPMLTEEIMLALKDFKQMQIVAIG